MVWSCQLNKLNIMTARNTVLPHDNGLLLVTGRLCTQFLTSISLRLGHVMRQSVQNSSYHRCACSLCSTVMFADIWLCAALRSGLRCLTLFNRAYATYCCLHNMDRGGRKILLYQENSVSNTLRAMIGCVFSFILPCMNPHVPANIRFSHYLPKDGALGLWFWQGYWRGPK